MPSVAAARAAAVQASRALAEEERELSLLEEEAGEGELPERIGIGEKLVGGKE